LQALLRVGLNAPLWDIVNELVRVLREYQQDLQNAIRECTKFVAHIHFYYYLFSDYTRSLDDIGYDRECKLSELQRYEMQLVQCNEQIHNVSLMCVFIIIIITYFQLRLVDVEHQRQNHLTQHKQHNHLPNLHVNDCRRHRYALQVGDYYLCITLATCTF
jgi:hypothetical protein